MEHKTSFDQNHSEGWFALRLKQLSILLLLLAFFLALNIVGEFFSAEPVEVEVEKVVAPISGKEIVRGNTDLKQVIFTFDGGSGDSSLKNILDVLKKHNVKGTFFLTGKFAETYPEDVKQISSADHEIFNHTYDHPHLTEISDDEIVQQLEKMDGIVRNISNIKTKPYFRPPYGDRNDRVLDIAYKAGFESVYWTVDARDWQEPNITADEVKNIILSNVSPGTIYLMHLGDNITGQILDEVFSSIESMGYKIVSLTQGI